MQQKKGPKTKLIFLYAKHNLLFLFLEIDLNVKE